MPVVNANSVDPDQTPRSVASDLGLHCLPMSHLLDAGHKWHKWVNALVLQAEGRRFETRSDRGNFQTISTPSTYSAYPWLSIKWTGRRLVTQRHQVCMGDS